MGPEIDSTDNFKIKIHKICQKNSLPDPVCLIEEEEDENDHCKKFNVSCKLIGFNGDKITGLPKREKSKQFAKHKAAQSALELFKQVYPAARGI